MFEEVTIGECRLILGDCREVLPLLPDFDLILIHIYLPIQIVFEGRVRCRRRISGVACVGIFGKNDNYFFSLIHHLYFSDVWKCRCDTSCRIVGI